jgi:hypothetical protein
VKATGAHIGLLGHITPAELRVVLSKTDRANGFANRILWVASRRSKHLSRPKPTPPAVVAEVGRRLSAALMSARRFGEIDLTPDAEAAWDEVYRRLEGTPRIGAFGKVTTRASAQALRLALVYALLDSSPVIERKHIEAGVAVWDYCEASARYVFGNEESDAGTPLAARVLNLLRQRYPECVSRVDVWSALGRNCKAVEVDAVRDALLEAGTIDVVTIATGGRPAEGWCLSSGDVRGKEGTKEVAAPTSFLRTHSGEQDRGLPLYGACSDPRAHREIHRENPLMPGRSSCPNVHASTVREGGGMTGVIVGVTTGVGQ